MKLRVNSGSVLRSDPWKSFRASLDLSHYTYIPATDILGRADKALQKEFGERVLCRQP